MTSPLPPTPPPDGATDEAGLRRLLAAEAGREPPVSPDFRAGVDRRVRRHRARTVALAAPAVAVVVAGAVVLAPRATTDTSLATASDPTAEPAPAPDAAQPAVVTVTDCGTVELGPDRVDPEVAPIDCFIDAFEAGTDATLTVLTRGPAGGTITQSVATAPGKRVTIASSGSLSMALPSFGLGGGGSGLVPADPGGAAVDCGTVTVTASGGSQGLTADTTSCLLRLVTAGDPGGLTLVATDDAGGTLNVRVDVGADRIVTVTVDGTVTQALPELTVPADLTDRLPPNGFGLDGLGLDGSGPGLGGFGADGPFGPTTTAPAEPGGS